MSEEQEKTRTDSENGASDSLHVFKAIGRVKLIGVKSEDESTVINLCTEIALLEQEVERSNIQESNVDFKGLAASGNWQQLQNLLVPKDNLIVKLTEELEKQKEKNEKQDLLSEQNLELQAEVQKVDIEVQTDHVTSSIDACVQVTITKKPLVADESTQTIVEIGVSNAFTQTTTHSLEDKCTQVEVAGTMKDHSTQHIVKTRNISTQFNQRIQSRKTNSTGRIKRASPEEHKAENASDSSDASAKLPPIRSNSSDRKRERRKIEILDVVQDEEVSRGYHSNCVPKPIKSKHWVF
eukprot:gene17376-19115_t